MRLKYLAVMIASMAIAGLMAGVILVCFEPRLPAGRIEEFVALQKERYIAGHITAEELVQAIDDRLKKMQVERSDAIQDVYGTNEDRMPFDGDSEPDENEE